MERERTIFKDYAVIAVLILLILITSCKKQESKEIVCDQQQSEKLNQAFIDASKVFQINEVKEVVIDNSYNANRCILIGGGSSFVSPDVIYKEYVEKQIPEVIAKKLMRENIGEGVNLFFLKNDEIICSIKSGYADSMDSIYFTEISKKVTFLIQLPKKFTEKLINDPNFLAHPEIGQDYLTNPKHLKPIEIIGIR